MSDVINFCLGLNPPRPNSIKLKFSVYADLAALPKIPADFGHEEYVPPINWGMLANDQYGDCVVAGGAHEHMLWAKMGGNNLTFNAADVLADQRAINGGIPNGPMVGTDMHAAASYRLKTGLLGADGKRHKVAAYVSLKPGDLRELYAAMYLFGAVGVGIQVTSAQIDQFRRQKAWAVSSGRYEGGHYVPCMALRSNIVCVTWGRFQAMRPSFYASENMQTVAYISQEAMVNQKSPEGFDYQALLADLQAIAA